MQKELVSVVIPAYNAAIFIQETIDSILKQTYQDFEIIVINDGSKDNTEDVVKSIKDSRIRYFYQNNEGVSIARNYGFQLSKGKYVVFFDADDIMSVDFLESRVKVLNASEKLSFCCSEVRHFPIKNNFKIVGACNNIPQEVLLYEKNIATCPSNYMIKKNILLEYDIKFHPRLSSTADRYFILELSKFAKGKLISEGILFYRINDQSMSNKLTEKLVTDNELFYDLLIKSELIPQKIYITTLFKGYYILFAANLKISSRIKGLIFLLKAFSISPKLFFMKIAQPFIKNKR